jgi:hypothetical protein
MWMVDKRDLLLELQSVLWIRITDSTYYPTVMRILILDFLFYADQDPTFHPDADTEPDPSFKKKAWTLEKMLK